MNKMILIGNLGREPEMSYTQSGTAVTKFSLAVSRSAKNAGGEWVRETDWYNITLFGKLAETSNQYLHKGSKVYLEGRLTPRKYTDRNGKEATSLDIIANEMEMLTPKEGQSGGSGFVGGSHDDNDALGDLEDHPF